MLLQIPGGPELIVILLVMVLLFGIPLVIVGVLGALYLRNRPGTDGDVSQRIEELEGEITALRAELADDGVTGNRDVAGTSDPADSGGEPDGTSDGATGSGPAEDDRRTDDDSEV